MTAGRWSGSIRRLTMDSSGALEAIGVGAAARGTGDAAGFGFLGESLAPPADNGEVR